MISAADILSARILVVDDDREALGLLEQLLTGAGYNSVATTSDPRSVLGMHRERDFDEFVRQDLKHRRQLRAHESETNTR